MALDTLEIFLLIVLAIVAGISVFFFVVADRYDRDVSKATLTRGLTGKEGTSLKLTCPKGRKITIGKTYLACGGVSATGNAAGCPISNPDGSLNTDDLNEITSTLSNKCNGHETCDITVPQSMTACGGCASSNQEIYMLGTYNCEV